MEVTGGATLGTTVAMPGQPFPSPLPTPSSLPTPLLAGDSVDNHMCHPQPRTLRLPPLDVCDGRIHTPSGSVLSFGCRVLMLLNLLRTLRVIARFCWNVDPAQAAGRAGLVIRPWKPV